jgi:hypothetical protein
VKLHSNDHTSKEKYFQNDIITGLPRTTESYVKPLDFIMSEEDGFESLASIVILDLLHVNAVQLCCLSSTTNEGSEHEIAITTSMMIMSVLLGGVKG